MIDRKTAPEPEGKINFVMPKINRFFLPNGIEVLHVEKKKLPIIYSDLIYFSGSKYDPIQLNGLANLTANLMDEGAAEYDALELSNQFELLGTSYNVTTDADTITFSLLSLAENFPRSVELLKKILIEPRFDEKDFKREKKKNIDKISQLKDNPAFVASTAFERRIFDGTVYQHPEIGLASTIGNISNNEIKDFYSNSIFNKRTVLIIVGNIELNDVEKLFSAIPYNGISESADSLMTESITNIKPVNYFIHKADSAQSEIRIGHTSLKRNSPNYISAKIMNTILGGQFSSRINLNLREQKGFTYGAGSAFQFYKDAGWFEVSTSVNIQNCGEAVKEIFKEFDGIKNGISNNEIGFAKSYLIKQIPSRFETYTQIAKNLETIILYSLPIDDLINHASQIEKTADEEILIAANREIKIEQMTTLIVGDREKILPQLKELSAVEPVELDLEGNLL